MNIEVKKMEHFYTSMISGRDEWAKKMD